jgi:predicted restriction endonuclease
MEEIYKDNNLDNVYNDILNADNLPLQYNTWKLYLEEGYNIQIKPIEELINQAKSSDIRKNRKANFKNKLMELGFTSCLVCGIKNTKLLQGCHIHDHSKSLNDDINNGVILCKNCHGYFDEVKYFYIDKVEENYIIITKNEINEEFNEYHGKIVNELKSLPKIDRYLKFKKNEFCYNKN